MSGPYLDLDSNKCQKLKFNDICETTGNLNID